MRGKGGIGGIEEMMAFVEDVAQRCGVRIVRPPPVARLNHDQRVVGDDDIGLARGAPMVRSMKHFW